MYVCIYLKVYNALLQLHEYFLYIIGIKNKPSLIRALLKFLFVLDCAVHHR